MHVCSKHVHGRIFFKLGQCMYVIRKIDEVKIFINDFFKEFEEENTLVGNGLPMIRSINNQTYFNINGEYLTYI